MIARHDGAIVFVSGAIPGEVVEAEIEKVQRGTAWAATREVARAIARSRRRRAGRRVRRVGIRAHRLRAATAAQERDHRRCVQAHRAHHARIARGGGRLAGRRLSDARAAARARRTHRVLSGRHAFAVRRRADAPAARRHDRGDPPARIIARAVNRDSRGRHRDRGKHRRVRARRSSRAAAGRGRLAAGRRRASRGRDRRVVRAAGECADDGAVGIDDDRRPDPRRAAGSSRPLVLPGQSLLLAPLVEYVLPHVGTGSLVDLYAGVGLFSLTAAAAGAGPITAVEGDLFAARDLKRNAKGEIAVRGDAGGEISRAREDGRRDRRSAADRHVEGGAGARGRAQRAALRLCVVRRRDAGA